MPSLASSLGSEMPGVSHADMCMHRLNKAIVTKTIITASQDLLHFFIVLLSVYTCMAVFGYLLFGQDVEDFSTWDRHEAAIFPRDLDRLLPRR